MYSSLRGTFYVIAEVEVDVYVVVDLDVFTFTNESTSGPTSITLLRK
jgi:hypothetical protein